MAGEVARDVRQGLTGVVVRLAAPGVPLEGRYVPFMASLADARILVLDGRGGILASSLSPPDATAWTAALAGPGSPWPPARGSGPGVSEFAVGDESFLVAAAATAHPGPEAAVLAAVPLARVTQAQKAAVTPLLWLLGLQSLAILVIGAGVAASLTRPLARLAGQARRIAAGDLTPRLSARRGDEIGVLAETLDGMVASLREAQAARVQAERLATLGRISAGLAHEIRNPLSSIRMHVQVLGRQPGADSATSRLLLAEIDRLDGILSELLTWARPSELRREAVDLGVLLDEALELMRPQLEHRGIRVSRHADAVPPLNGDRERLRQLLRNLLANARDALGTGGTLTVRLAPGGAGVRLEVADDGPGIPAEIRDRVFEPFVTGRRDGTGLGLALAKRAVEDHGGALGFESGSGGTVFRVDLPLG